MPEGFYSSPDSTPLIRIDTLPFCYLLWVSGTSSQGPSLLLPRRLWSLLPGLPSDDLNTVPETSTGTLYITVFSPSLLLRSNVPQPVFTSYFLTLQCFYLASIFQTHHFLPSVYSKSMNEQSYWKRNRNSVRFVRHWSKVKEETSVRHKPSNTHGTRTLTQEYEGKLHTTSIETVLNVVP